MSLFDIFTGESAKKAAKENMARLDASRARGTDTLNMGQTNALSSLDAAAGAYDPVRALSAKYGAGTDLYLDSLGVNGAEGNARATGSFQAGPGYDWRVSQSLDQLNRAANANGGLVGGNTLAALSDRAGNMANQEFGSWQDRLAGLIAPEVSSTNTAAGGTAGVNMGKAGVYQDTAGKIVGLDQNVTGGINSQNTQAANAAMAGSGNLWSLGLNAAKAIATGGTSLLGGGGQAMSLGNLGGTGLQGYGGLY